jgi:MerR family transcriptional regulator, copper efflux regulator
VNRDNHQDSFLRSGRLAKLAGVSADTLRHYERLGLLPRPRRSANGYREYPQETLDRVRLVQKALRVGFSLAELARILKSRDKGGVPCREVRALAETKLRRLEEQLREMTCLRDELRATLKDWDSRLAAANEQRAGLLEALVAAESPDLKSASASPATWRKRKERTTRNDQL